MTLLDKTILTCDEEYEPHERIADAVRSLIDGLKLDTYNAQYVVHISVHKVDCDTSVTYGDLNDE